MACVICADLERALELRRSKYMVALSSAYYRVSTQVVAHKNVDMERAKNDLEEHRVVCVAAGRWICSSSRERYAKFPQAGGEAGGCHENR